MKTAELESSIFDVKSFLRQSLSYGGEIATIYNCILGSNISFKNNFDFTYTSFEVVQALITLQHNTLHFFCCTALHQTDEAILLNHDYINNNGYF